MRIGMMLGYSGGFADTAAAAAVPDELVRSVSLIGPESYVAERIEAFRAAGVTTLTVSPMAPDADGRVRLVERLRVLCG